jgi:aminoglycoside 3-N-acetyltransferase
MNIHIKENIYSVLKKILPKILFNKLRQLKRAAARIFTRKVDKEEILRDLLVLGISSGDTLYVYSSLSRIGNVVNGASDVINALLDAVGPEGTLAFPCHLSPQLVIDNYKNGGLLDLRLAKPHTGAVPNLALTLNGAERSSHPFASTCAIGKHAAHITEDHDLDPRVCHPKSPLAKLLGLNGKLIGLGTDFAAIAFYHVIEDIDPGFPFDVYLSPDEISYIDFKGSQINRKIMRYDPIISESRIERPGGRFIRGVLLKHFRESGIIKETKVGNAAAWIMCANVLHNELKKLLSQGLTIYTTKAEFENLNSKLSN